MSQNQMTASHYIFGVTLREVFVQSFPASDPSASIVSDRSAPARFPVG